MCKHSNNINKFILREEITQIVEQDKLTTKLNCFCTAGFKYLVCTETKTETFKINSYSNNKNLVNSQRKVLSFHAHFLFRPQTRTNSHTLTQSFTPTFHKTSNLSHHRFWHIGQRGGGDGSTRCLWGEETTRAPLHGLHRK